MRRDAFSQCPYLAEKQSRIEYFFATAVTPEEYNKKLARGWRRFGYFFFRPSCGTCFECVPIRIHVDRYRPTKSQRRVVRKNSTTRVVFRKLAYSDEIFEIYREHSLDRFSQQSNRVNFMNSFFTNVMPAMQTEYYVGDLLAAVGFVDIASEALSSVYFVYRTKYAHLSLGTFGVVREMELARSLGYKYYYLGYYVAGNHSMAYKNRFRPYDLYDWQEEQWREAAM